MNGPDTSSNLIDPRASESTSGRGSVSLQRHSRLRRHRLCAHGNPACHLSATGAAGVRAQRDHAPRLRGGPQPGADRLVHRPGGDRQSRGAIRRRIRGDVRPAGPHRLPQSESGRGDARQRPGATLRRRHSHRAPGAARQPLAGAELRRRRAPGPLHRVRPAGLAGQRRRAISRRSPTGRRGARHLREGKGRRAESRINNRPVRIEGDQVRPVPRKEVGCEGGRPCGWPSAS